MAEFEVKVKGKINCFDILLEEKSTKILKNLLTAATCLAHEIIRAERRGETAYLIFVTNPTNISVEKKLSCGEISDFYA